MKELRWLREEPKSHAFFLFIYLFIYLFYHMLCIINYGEQRRRGALAMAKKKLHPHFYPPRRQGKSHEPKSLWYETKRTPATQNKKSPSN